MPQGNLHSTPADNDLVDSFSTSNHTQQYSTEAGRHPSSPLAPDNQTTCTKQESNAFQGSPGLSPTGASLKQTIIENRAYWVVALFVLTMALYVLPPQTPFGRHGDAGSMGSRIHAYKFNYCNATPELEYETFDHVEPGLSSYGEDAERAAQSLDKLLDGALNTIPGLLHTSTPIAVKATAGLRLLGEERSNRILDAVRQRIVSNYPFQIIEEQGVAVMDGVFAWVTVNYLLDRFNSLEKKPTVAILDLGGASTQVVFEPGVVNGHSVAQGTHRYPMNFNGNEYILYQHSHLGYGLMLARTQINNYVVENPISFRHRVRLGQDEYAHPCLPPVMDMSVEDDIYAFSFFFDLTAPFRLGTATPAQEMTIAELEELTAKVCIGDENDFAEFHNSAEAMKEIRKSADLCMDLSYIYGLLEYGYSIPKHRKIKLAKKLKGHETGWCVGASIAVLEERDWFNGSPAL
ncbi:Guanosine-diphosphatase [Mortierella sp. GBA43]|nr:Guanosine-diphosphatase [Mortierella sp. GBA43]